MDDQPTRGFGALSLTSDVAGVGAASGRWIQQVSSNRKVFDIDSITGLPAGISLLREVDGAVDQLPVLAQPIDLQVVDASGARNSWCSPDVASSFRWTKRASGRLAWTARASPCGRDASASALQLEVNGTLSFDGYFDYRVRVTCTAAGGCPIGTMALLLNYSTSASRFAMGLGARGMQWPPQKAHTAPPPDCLPRNQGNQVGTRTVVGSKVLFSYWNTIQDLCSKTTGSSTEYSGHVCAANGDIHWDGFSTLLRRSGLANATCAWNCSEGPGTEYCGICGHHAPGTLLVPTRLCSAVAPSPPQTPGLEWRWADAVNATAHGEPAKMGWIGWVGSSEHGLRLKLKGQEAVWDGPLNPMSVCDEGTHVCVGPGGSAVRAPSGWAHGESAGLTLSTEAVLSAHTGEIQLAAGESVDMRFDLVTTPAKPRDPAHWHRRYLMGCGGCDVYGAQYNQSTGHVEAPHCLSSASNYGEKVENASLMGFNAVVLHQGCPLNPFINWPFDPNVTRQLGAFTAARHAQGIGVQMYYTVRELSNRAAEFPVLRSLGQEILVDGNTSAPGGIPMVQGGAGGVSWLQEHMRHHYKTGWTTNVRNNITDAAVQNVGASRWANYYVEGMRRLACYPPFVDGVELDGLAYPRSVTERLRKVTERCDAVRQRRWTADGNGTQTIFNEHVSDDFPGQGVAGVLKYMEHFPFVDSLVTGEVFDYTGSPSRGRYCHVDDPDYIFMDNTNEI
jgi:hypothetical protein